MNEGQPRSVGERASASASSRDVFVGGCPDCGGCAHGPDGRCPLDTEKVSSTSASCHFEQQDKWRCITHDRDALACNQAFQPASPSAALPVAVDHEDTAEARTDYPRGQALEMLLEDLRGHARWLALKGYDHFAKQIHWAANIIEGLSDD